MEALRYKHDSRVFIGSRCAPHNLTGPQLQALLYGDHLDNDACYASTLAWSMFVDSHRHLFSPNRRKLAAVAILYSVPSRMWVQDTTMAVPFDWITPGKVSLPLSDVLAGVARVAEDHHILYDVLIMDHPDLSNFGHLDARLDEFLVAVLPVVVALSDRHAERLANWVRNGGTLVAVDWEQTGKRI